MLHIRRVCVSIHLNFMLPTSNRFGSGRSLGWLPRIRLNLVLPAGTDEALPLCSASCAPF